MTVVILAQSAATSRAYAARNDESFDENVDLVGLALANLGAAFSGTFVVNGSPTKTQMVASAGGRSQLSQLVTSLVVLLVLLVLTGPLAYMPRAVLSAVVFLIGIELIDLHEMRRILAVRPIEFAVAAITTAVVVGVGVEQGILVAMVLSLLAHVRRGYRPKNAVVVHRKGEPRPEPVSTQGELAPGLLVYRFNHSMYYANAAQLSEEVSGLIAGEQPKPRWFCFDMAAVDDVDYSAAQTLRSLFRALQQHRIRPALAEVGDGVRTELERYGLVKMLGANAIFGQVADVLKAFQADSPATGEPPQGSSNHV
jgi:sulfate permease, SulP family